MKENEVVESWPVLDWGSLEKGQYLSVEACATALGMPVPKLRDTPQGRFALLTLADTIRKRRDDLACHIRTRDSGIEVMLDDEAERHSWRAMQQAIDKHNRYFNSRASLDRTAFDSEQRRAAEAHDFAGARMMIESNRVRAEMSFRLQGIEEPKALGNQQDKEPEE